MAIVIDGEVIPEDLTHLDFPNDLSIALRAITKADSVDIDLMEERYLRRHRDGDHDFRICLAFQMRRLMPYCHGEHAENWPFWHPKKQESAGGS